MTAKCHSAPLVLCYLGSEMETRRKWSTENYPISPGDRIMFLVILVGQGSSKRSVVFLQQQEMVRAGKISFTLN